MPKERNFDACIRFWKIECRCVRLQRIIHYEKSIHEIVRRYVKKEPKCEVFRAAQEVTLSEESYKSYLKWQKKQSSPSKRKNLEWRWYPSNSRGRNHKNGKCSDWIPIHPIPDLLLGVNLCEYVLKNGVTKPPGVIMPMANLYTDSWKNDGNVRSLALKSRKLHHSSNAHNEEELSLIKRMLQSNGVYGLVEAYVRFCKKGYSVVVFSSIKIKPLLFGLLPK